MSIVLDILNGIKADLQTIVASNTVDVQGTTYTYQTNIGANVVTGLSLLDVEESDYPAAAINNVSALAGDSLALPDMAILASFSVESANTLGGGDWLTVADAMVSDIQAAVDLAPAVQRGRLIQPGAAGRPVFEWLKPAAASDVVMVRCWYSITYQTRFRVTGLLS